MLLFVIIEHYFAYYSNNYFVNSHKRVDSQFINGINLCEVLYAINGLSHPLTIWVLRYFKIYVK